MSKKEKWDSEVDTYLASLAATDKAIQEGFIRDSGIAPGFVSFLKVQERTQDARHYQALMRWHRRDKQPEKKKQRTSPPNKGWTRTPDRQFKNLRDASAAVQMELDEFSTSDERQAKHQRKRSDSIEAVPIELDHEPAHATILQTNDDAFVNTAVTPFERDARLPVEFPEAKAAPAPAVSVLCTKHHCDEPHLFTSREWQLIRQHEWDSAASCGPNERIREKQWPRATGGGFSLLVKGSLPGKMPTSGRRNEQLKRQLARDLLATLQHKFPEAVVHPDGFIKEPSLTPLQALFLMKDSHISYNKCACVCSLW
jgi:hypothetical protein